MSSAYPPAGHITVRHNDLEYIFDVDDYGTLYEYMANKLGKDGSEFEIVCRRRNGQSIPLPRTGRPSSCKRAVVVLAPPVVEVTVAFETESFPHMDEFKVQVSSTKQLFDKVKVHLRAHGVAEDALFHALCVPDNIELLPSSVLPAGCDKVGIVMHDQFVKKVFTAPGESASIVVTAAPPLSGSWVHTTRKDTSSSLSSFSQPFVAGTVPPAPTATAAVEQSAIERLISTPLGRSKPSAHVAPDVDDSLFAHIKATKRASMVHGATARVQETQTLELYTYARAVYTPFPHSIRFFNGRRRCGESEFVSMCDYCSRHIPSTDNAFKGMSSFYVREKDDFIDICAQCRGAISLRVDFQPANDSEMTVWEAPCIGARTKKGTFRLAPAFAEHMLEDVRLSAEKVRDLQLAREVGYVPNVIADKLAAFTSKNAEQWHNLAVTVYEPHPSEIRLQYVLAQRAAVDIPYIFCDCCAVVIMDLRAPVALEDVAGLTCRYFDDSKDFQDICRPCRSVIMTNVYFSPSDEGGVQVSNIPITTYQTAPDGTPLQAVTVYHVTTINGTYVRAF